MVQEIIVYIILGATFIHLIVKAIGFFKPQKNASACSSCTSGSCASCSLKFDMNSIKVSPMNNPTKKSPFVKR